MNKLTKLLSVFVLAGAIGAGAGALAGCGHKHTFSEDWSKDATQHWHAATCEHGDEKSEVGNHVDSDNNGKCDVCDYQMTTPSNPNTPSNPSSDKLQIPAEVQGIRIKGIANSTQTLSPESPSYTIDKSAIKVVYLTGADANVEGDEIPAANYDLSLKFKGATLSSWADLKTDGEYKISVTLKDAEWADGELDDLTSTGNTITITIVNPVVATSLAVKEGTKTQAASVQDKMSSTWKYTITYANGDVVDYTDPVTVTMDTTRVGTQTAQLSAADGAITGTVQVEITQAQNVVQSYVLFNVNNYTSAPTGTITSKNEGATKLDVVGLSVAANNDSSSQKYDDKYFNMRSSFGGGTFLKESSGGGVQTDATKQRYFTLKAEGAAKVTIYWSRNSNADSRGVAVYDSATVDGDITKLNFTTATSIKRDVSDDGSATGDNKAIHKTEANIPAAGTYWITTANENDIYIYYIEISTEFPEDSGKTAVAIDAGENKLVKLDVTHDQEAGSAYVQKFSEGDNFSVDGGYVITGTYVTENTAVMSDEDLSDDPDIKYYIGETELVKGTTQLNSTIVPGLVLGGNTVTVKYKDETVVGTYTINVTNALGIDSVTASLGDKATQEVADAGSTVTVSRSDITLTAVGTNKDNVDMSIESATYKAKDGSGSDTDILAEESTTIGVGEWVITVVVKVTDKTQTTLTKNYTATCNLTVKVHSDVESWLYQTGRATPNASDPGVQVGASADPTIPTSSTSYTAKALIEAKAGMAKDASFYTSDKSGGINKTGNEPKLAQGAGPCATAEAVTFTNALMFNSQPGEGGKDYIEITANEDITIYVYVNLSDGKHNSDRYKKADETTQTPETYAQYGYKIDDGEVTKINCTARKTVDVISVSLTAGQKLTISAYQNGYKDNPYLWLYGIEATLTPAD